LKIGGPSGCWCRRQKPIFDFLTAQNGLFDPQKINDARSLKASLTSRLTTQRYILKGLNYQELFESFDDSTAVCLTIDVTKVSGSRRVKEKCRLHLQELEIREECQSVWSSIYIQGDSGGKVNILGRDSICPCEKNNLYEHVSNSELLPR
jgi:hypothetical protein